MTNYTSSSVLRNCSENFIIIIVGIGVGVGGINVIITSILSCTRKHMDKEKVTQRGDFLLQNVCVMIYTGLESTHDQDGHCLSFLMHWRTWPCLASQSTPDCLHWKMYKKDKHVKYAKRVENSIKRK